MLELLNDITLHQWAMLVAAAIMIGINKPAIPGIGILPVVALAAAFEARLSTGL